MVWSDLYVQQFLPNLKMTGRYNKGSARDLIASDVGYEMMIHSLFRRKYTSEFKFENCTVFSPRTMSNWLVQFPKPYTLQQRVFELERPLSNILRGTDVAFESVVLYSMCRDKEWRTR